ncbi:hypothetical protein BCR34DRAFT_157293 [Clohesyomyces aquaticus]|uniref:Uncharacterized protein n=1 Tax=Clohesyomyces aquaticus TaxID=1231657 RepID=A0A1Y1YJC9_9PLEO|nr:hypothetical protein BCR34DRAFT_157293 [Clohesyomyces aquaticus]
MRLLLSRLQEFQDFHAGRAIFFIPVAPFGQIIHLSRLYRRTSAMWASQGLHAGISRMKGYLLYTTSSVWSNSTSSMIRQLARRYLDISRLERRNSHLPLIPAIGIVNSHVFNSHVFNSHVFHDIASAIGPCRAVEADRQRSSAYPCSFRVNMAKLRLQRHWKRHGAVHAVEARPWEILCCSSLSGFAS